MYLQESEIVGEGAEDSHKRITGTDYNTRWTYDSIKGVVEVRPYRSGGPSPFRTFYRNGDWRAGYAKVVNKGRKAIDGEDCYRIEISFKSGGRKKVSYYSVETGLLVRSDFRVGPMTLRTTYSDYKNFDGLILPTVTRVGTLGVGMVYTLVDARINAEIPMSVFEPPAEVRAVMNK
jgi:outer membrane lipoprotein-sorting protein